MTTKYVVAEGDCVSSIAMELGYLPKTIWEDPSNRALKQKRVDPNVLFPGDSLYIRDFQLRVEHGSTEQRHRFRRKGVPEQLNIVLRIEGEPRRNAKFSINIDGDLSEGITDDDGRATFSIPPNAKQGELELNDGGEIFTLNLGVLDPISEITGIQARLENLGYPATVTGEWDEHTKRALHLFQKRHNLQVSDKIDDVTSHKLAEICGDEE